MCSAAGNRRNMHELHMLMVDGGGGGDDANDCSTSEEEEEEVYLTAQVATSLIRISPIKQVSSILLSG